MGATEFGGHVCASSNTADEESGPLTEVVLTFRRVLDFGLHACPKVPRWGSARAPRPSPSCFGNGPPDFPEDASDHGSAPDSGGASAGIVFDQAAALEEVVELEEEMAPQG